MKSKMGASHVEMILAFVIFIIFVIFLIYYLKPFGNSSVLEDSILLDAKDKFFGNTSVELVTVLVNSSTPCKPTISNTDGMNVLNISAGKPGFFYAYFSKGLDNNPSLTDCSSFSAELGNIERNVVLSNISLMKFKENYNTDYDALKAYLGLPPTVDFAILSTDYTLEKRSPENVKTIAGAYRKQILFSNGTLINKDFIIKVW